MATGIKRELRRLLVRSDTGLLCCRSLLRRLFIKLLHCYVSALVETSSFRVATEELI